MAKGAGSTKVNASPQMKAAWRRYESGDVVAARREAREILKGSPTPADAEQARDLIERTKIPRTGLYFAVLATGLVAVMILLGVARG